MKHIKVVGAVIFKNDLVLCAQRGSSASLPGLWEFPGGKIEINETPKQALIREIHEELGCEISVGDEIATTNHQYDFGIVELTTFECQLLSGEPKPIEHESLTWLSPHELRRLEWAPADLPTIEIVESKFRL